MPPLLFGKCFLSCSLQPASLKHPISNCWQLMCWLQTLRLQALHSWPMTRATAKFSFREHDVVGNVFCWELTHSQLYEMSASLSLLTPLEFRNFWVLMLFPNSYRLLQWFTSSWPISKKPWTLNLCQYPPYLNMSLLLRALVWFRWFWWVRSINLVAWLGWSPHDSCSRSLKARDGHLAHTERCAIVQIVWLATSGCF